MPQKQEHRTKPNQRVRIKDDVTHMYPKARVYNEGVVGKQTHDEFGYPLIYVEWDKDHWAYSGEEDRWVLESHFDPIEGKMAENPDFMEALAELLAQYKNNTEDKPEERPKGELPYDEMLSNALEEASDGEAYIVFVARSESYQDANLIVPRVFVNYKSESAALMLNAAVSDYVTQTLARLAQEHEQNS